MKPKGNRMVGTIGKSGWARWLVVSFVMMAACGNRLSREEILAQNTVSGSRAAGSSQGSDDDVGGLAAGDAGEQSRAGRQSGSGSSNEAESRAQGGGAKAPIVLGFVGWLSGIGGPTNNAVLDALKAWQRMVNARGGINGHTVELLVGDDGGNESRSVSLVRDFVENRGATAIIFGGAAVTGVGNYAKSKRVPIIGGAASEPVWHENPMLFPPSGGIYARYGGSARVNKNAGIKKVGVVYCVEAATCRAAKDTYVSFAREDGLEVVYEGQISFTQPDYTAECLNMRNAGAELGFPITETTSLIRLAQSCARQGYRPIWDVLVGDDSMQKMPEFEGAIGSGHSFPWFMRSGAPGVEEYAQALGKYAPHRLTDGASQMTWGWTSAKIFEKAAANVSDQPTSEDILNGLWAMKGETLGGLLPGRIARTYTRDQPTPDTLCVYYSRIESGKWVAPQGLTPACTDAIPPHLRDRGFR